MHKKRSLTNVSVVLISLTLVGLMITSIGLSGMNNAAAQNNSSSNMSSASVTNATSTNASSTNESSSMQANSPYKFERGYPAPGTAERAYNDTDLGRAIEVYKYFYPTMYTESFVQDISKNLKPNQTAVKFHAGPRHEFLTGNGDTPYGTGGLDLKAEGPMVIELPAGNFLAFVQDHNMHWIIDMGLIGPDKGQGGKYLILPPDYQGDIPVGYNVGRSETWKVLLFARTLPQEGNITEALDAFDGIKVYPLAKAGEPVTFQFIDVTNKTFDNNLLKWDGNLDYWKQLKAIVDSETTPAYLRSMYGMLQSLGIEKGKPFNPDARMTSILEKAAQTALAEMRVNSFANRNPERFVWNDRNWEWAPLRQLNTTTRDFGTASFQDLDTTIHAYFQAFGGSASLGKRQVGAGSLYFVGLRDDTGAYLDGGKNYKLTVPASVPASQFWSITVYDTDTRSMVVTDQDKAAIGSIVDKPQPNPDGSTDIYFGPNAPAGKENQWIKTNPGQGWFTYFRIYGPEAPAFEQTWRLNNIVEMK